MFVNVTADQVDSQIVSALRQIVEFLAIDRSGLAELLGDQMVITHSFERPGVPPSPRVILEAHFPFYARKVRAGDAFRLPDDLPPEATVEREFLIRTGLKSNLTIPLKVTGSVVGGLGFASFHEPIEWPDELVRRLRLVGDIFTNALARKRADETLRALAAKLLTAQEEERRRVAREMHDDWTQRLAILNFDVVDLENHLGDPAAALPLLRSMQTRLVALAEDVHALSRQLHPAILDDLGLAEAIRSECAAFSRREGITITYRTEAVPRAVPREVALCIYRVAQEALRNLAKHAAVNEGWVTLDGTVSELVLRVRDQGVGFNPAEVPADPGLGLASMEERVRLVRAALSITSASGRGTTVEVRAPLREGDA
ncbi:MAG: ATP-binding protein [Gemmataceae bacterium]